MPRPQSAIIIAATALLFTAFVSSPTQPSTPNAHSFSLELQQTSSSINPEELENFTDQEIANELVESGVPGAAVIIVKDGAIVLAKGYGVADKERNLPVVVNQTLFRIASVTKLFTWTAVMQLVEQGRLNLDVDVNNYLKTFKIPQTYPKPITIKNLMSHNAGFESDENLGWVPSNADLLPLSEYLARYTPARVRPPDELCVYSNYGASLAGYIVEQVSATPFSEYVQENILDPLKMEHTSLTQPLPPGLAASMSKSYVLTEGSAEAFPLGYYMGTPAAAICSTAGDMAHFIIAHLQDGAFEGQRILQRNTTEEMHQRLFTMDPRVPGYAHGFQEYSINNQRIIGHFGDLDAFKSALLLIPDHDLGWFIVYNGRSDTASPGSFMTAFLNHYFPTEPYIPPVPPTDFSQREGQFIGYYRDARLSHTTFRKLTSLTIEFPVTSTQHATLLVRGEEYVEDQPFLFKPYGISNPWNDTLLFLNNPEGKVQYFSYAVGTFERVPWFETSAFTWTLLVTCSALFISVPIVLLLRLILNRVEPKQKKQRSNWITLYHLLSLSFCVLFALSVVGVRFAGSNLAVWNLVMTAGFTGSILAIASLFFVVLSWKYMGFYERLQCAVITTGGLVFIWFLSNWQLLSFRLA